VIVLALCLAGVQVASQNVRLQDAAALAARSLARGDPPSTAAALAARQVRGAGLAVSSSDGVICATLEARAQSPLGSLLGLTLRARSCAMGGGP
jgi:hypothetical protein